MRERPTVVRDKRLLFNVPMQNALKSRQNFQREISCFSPLNLGTLFRYCDLRQGTSPSNASFDSGDNEYLVGRGW